MRLTSENGEEMVIIPLRVFHTHLYVEKYFEAFWKHVQAGMLHREAWQAVEDELAEYGFPSRYDSYESFRVGKQYHYKKNTPLNFW